MGSDRYATIWISPRQHITGNSNCVGILKTWSKAEQAYYASIGNKVLAA